MRSDLGLTTQQERAAELLASGCTVEAVTQELEIHRATLANWKKLSQFEAYANQLMEERRAVAWTKMIALSEKATGALENLLESENEKIRLAAASAILRHLS